MASTLSPVSSSERYLLGLLGGSFLLARVMAAKAAPAGAPADPP
jgi:hypothetical protein